MSVSDTLIIKSSFHYQRVTCTFTEDRQVRFEVFDNSSFVTEVDGFLETAVVKELKWKIIKQVIKRTMTSDGNKTMY